MNVWSTKRTRPRASASSHSRRASSDEAVIGFSTHTCLPARRASRHSSKWVATGVTMATASIDPSASTSRRFEVVRSPGYASFTSASCLGLMSQTQATSIRPHARKLRTMLGPQ